QGIEIEMNGRNMHPRSAVDERGVEQIEPGRYFTTGTIHYPELAGTGLVGKLVYIKPGIYGGEPGDVLSYAATHLDFPHESAVDQWFFPASQYESYRQLGRHIAERLFGLLGENATLEDIVNAAAPTPESETAKETSTSGPPSGQASHPILHHR